VYKLIVRVQYDQYDHTSVSPSIMWYLSDEALQNVQKRRTKTTINAVELYSLYEYTFSLKLSLKIPCKAPML